MKPLSAMILAAGRGKRMRPMSDFTPKALLEVAGKPLILRHLHNLRRSGFKDVVINHAWLGEQIEQYLGDGSEWDISITYSSEGEALETGGGIFRALPLLQDPFLVINADIWTDIDFADLNILENDLAHLFMVANPEHHPEGDFFLDTKMRLHCEGHPKLTYSGVGVYHKSLFDGCVDGKFFLSPLLKNAMNEQKVSGELHDSVWMDIGTPERLKQLEALLASNH